MKIYLEAMVDGELTRYWLVGKDDMPLRLWSDAMGQSRQLMRNQQSGGGAMWANKTFRDRRNDGVIIEASTAREFGTELECWDFANAFSREDGDKPHPLSGDVYLRLELPGGAWVDEVIRKAVLSVTGIEVLGSVGLRLRYRISGPKTEAGFEGGSGTYSWLLDEEGHHVEDEDGFFIADEAHES